MYELKTQPHEADVDAFLAQIADSQQRADAQTLRQLMETISGEPAVMWGATMIGFGSYRYHNTSGQGRYFAVGFSPRKTNLTVYIMLGFENYGDLMAQLGKHKTGKSCLYIRRLSDINLGILQTLIEKSLIQLKATYPD